MGTPRVFFVSNRSDPPKLSSDLFTCADTHTSTHIFKKTQANNSSNNYNPSHDLREMETVIGWVESPAKWGECPFTNSTGEVSDNIWGVARSK